jgi:hypothetical protein
MNNVTMETIASLHSPYGRVKVKPFNFSREVQSTKSGQSIHKRDGTFEYKILERTQKGADLEKNL